MADPPPVTIKGAGTPREAASVAQRVHTALVPGLQQLREPMHIDRLHVQLPAGSSDAEFAKAVARAIAARQRTG